MKTPTKKPRFNYAIMGKGGPHKKTRKADRRKEKMSLKNKEE